MLNILFRNTIYDEVTFVSSYLNQTEITMRKIVLLTFLCDVFNHGNVIEKFVIEKFVN